MPLNKETKLKKKTNTGVAWEKWSSEKYTKDNSKKCQMHSSESVQENEINNILLDFKI